LVDNSYPLNASLDLMSRRYCRIR